MFPQYSLTLPRPFPMYAALPRSEYYDDSAPPVPSADVAPILGPTLWMKEAPWNGHGQFPRSLLSGRRVRHSAMPLRPRHGYAVDNSPWPPNPDWTDPVRSSPPVMKDEDAPHTNPHPPG